MQIEQILIITVATLITISFVVGMILYDERKNRLEREGNKK